MRKLTALLAIIASCVSLACKSGVTPPPDPSVTGTWNLTSINGASLPFTIQPANPKIELLNQQLIVASGGTFTQTGNVRLTDAGTVSTRPYADAGSWTLNGSAATFQFNSDGSAGTGTLSGNKFIVGQSGYSFEYTKQ
jgi:hypothetical protein